MNVALLGIIDAGTFVTRSQYEKAPGDGIFHAIPSDAICARKLLSHLMRSGDQLAD